MQHLVDKAGLADQIEVDSSGTAAYHVGERADARSRATAEQRGLRLDSIARRARPHDFERFDHLIAMDTDNMELLQRMAPGDAGRAKVRLLRSFDPKAPAGASVPDPYYGGDGGFDEVLDICEDACRGLLEHLREVHRLR